jgi:hypothetical protein
MAFERVPQLFRLFGFDTRLRVRSRAWLTGSRAEIAYGAGYAWVSVPADDSVARYEPRHQRVLTNVAGRRPAGLAVVGGRVFVACNRTIPSSSSTRRPAGGSAHPLPVPPNPWAVAAGEGHVWVSGLGANTVTRIDY